MLPAPCRWIDSDDGSSYLQWNAITVAIVRPDGAVITLVGTDNRTGRDINVGSGTSNVEIGSNRYE